MAKQQVLTVFGADTKDLEKGVKTVDKKMQGLSSSISKAFKVSAAAVGAVTAAIGAVVKKSVEAYAEFEQLEGGLVSLFGEGSEEMNRILQKSEDAYKDLTMSQNDYLESFQSSYPLVNAGLAKNKDSIEYTNKVLKLSADLFNTYGGSTEQYQSAINWALKGSFVYLDNLNLGIKGTQEGFIEAANKSGVLKKNIESVSELTNDEIIDVIEHYAKEYGVLDKTANEASETILGSINMMKASWENFISGLSKKDADLDKLIGQVVDSVKTVASNVLPVIMRALENLAKVLPEIVKVISDELPTLVNAILPPLIESIQILVVALVKALPGILKTTLPILINAIISITKALVEVLPEIIPILLEGALMIMYALAQELPTMLPAIVDAIMEIIPLLVENAGLFLNVGIQLMAGLLKGIVMSIPKIIAKIPSLLKALLKSFKDFFGIRSPSTVFANIGQMIMQGLWNGIKGLKDWVINKVKGIGKSILSGLKSVLGIHSPSTEFALIGKFSVLGFTEELDKMKRTVQGQVAETFQVSPQLANSSSLHYSPSVVVNNNINVEQDPLGQMVRSVKTFSGGAKNDYNYGMGV